MIEVTDNTLLTDKDLMEHFGLSMRKTREWMQTHGGKKELGTWVILGSIFKRHFQTDAPVHVPGSRKKNYERMSL